MKEIRLVIVDDDPAAIEVLVFHLKKLERVRLLGSFTCPLQALERLQTMEVDLAILDLDMQPIHGLELAALLDPEIHIIFCTGHCDFAVDSYASDAVDYLVKPVGLPRLIQGINKVERLMFPPGSSLRRNALSPDFLLIPKGGKHQNQKLRLSEIQYLEADRNGCIIYRSNHEPLKIPYSLSSLYAYLPKSAFLRVHKSFVIALECYLEYQRGFIRLSGKPQKTISVGEAYEQQLIAWIAKHSLKRER